MREAALRACAAEEAERLAEVGVCVSLQTGGGGANARRTRADKRTNPETRRAPSPNATRLPRAAAELAIACRTSRPTPKPAPPALRRHCPSLPQRRPATSAGGGHLSSARARPHYEAQRRSRRVAGAMLPLLRAPRALARRACGAIASGGAPALPASA